MHSSTNSGETRSYAMMIGSMLIFGTIGVFRRYIPLPSSLLAVARGGIGALFLCILVRLRGGTLRHHIGAKKFLLLALSGALMGINWILLFEAYNYTTVATATLCYYMEPTIVILLAPILFREHLSGKKLLCAAVSILGMVFVSGILDGGGVQRSELKGIIFGLAAACFYSSVVIMNKFVRIEDAYEKTVIQLSSAAVTLLPYLLLTQDMSSLEFSGFAFVMLAIVCLVHTGVAYALYFGSMGGLKAQSIAILSYIDPVFALILSALLLHEKMSLLGLVGAVLIIGAALLSELRISGRKAST